MSDSVLRCIRGVALVAALAGCAIAQAPAGGRASQAPAPAPGGRGRVAPQGGGLLAQAGSADKHIIDPAGAQRGQKVYAAECITCHGASARGAQNGPDLVRSVAVLHDRYGDQIGAVLKKGHPAQTRKPAVYTDAEISDLADFLHLKVADTMRTSPLFHAQNVLTGDAKAGEAYFNGGGKCSQCHSATGDLKGVGAKYDPVDMQQKFLFPKPAFGRGGRGGGGASAGAAKPVMVTVTPPSGPSITGTLDKLDDFNVSLRDKDGEYHGFTRTPQTKVTVDDPYKAHVELLERITDKNMHDVTAYLETLK
jgi:mono/diheme cytochrome c family protein